MMRVHVQRFYWCLTVIIEDLQSEIQLENGKNYNVRNVGSCGLHVIHGAFRSAMSETGWDIETLPTSAYRLFKDIEVLCQRLDGT